MRIVTVSITMLIADDARPEKWLPNAIVDNCLESDESLLDFTIVSDEPYTTEDEE